MDIAEIKTLKSVTDIKLRVLIYGESGTGKTRSAATFPDPFFFDFDGGMLSVRKALIDGTIDGKTYSHEDWREFRKDWDAVCKEPKHRTYVIDSFTTMAEAISYHIQKTKGNVNEALTLPQYGLIYNRLSQLMYEAVDIPTNIVILAHVQESIDEATGTVKELPLVSGKKFPDRLPIWFDEVFKQEMVKSKEGGFEPVWTVKHTRKSKAKSRLGIQADVIKPPTYQTYIQLLEAGS